MHRPTQKPRPAGWLVVAHLDDGEQVTAHPSKQLAHDHARGLRKCVPAFVYRISAAAHVDAVRAFLEARDGARRVGVVVSTTAARGVA